MERNTQRRVQSPARGNSGRNKSGAGDEGLDDSNTQNSHCNVSDRHLRIPHELIPALPHQLSADTQGKTRSSAGRCKKEASDHRRHNKRKKRSASAHRRLKDPDCKTSQFGNVLRDNSGKIRTRCIPDIRYWFADNRPVGDCFRNGWNGNVSLKCFT